MLRDPLSSTLASLPECFHSARSELLEMLRREGILHRSPNQPVLSRDGTSARWMLDSLAVTLSPKGGQLAGACITQLLKRFDGYQIATYGLTGVPILQSCLLQDNRYRGLLVRKERKQHGSLKLIEGFIDRNEPVILLDDSVSSGLSMEEATERLEEAGLRVEGGVCLVRFGWYGGYARMQERGYHMEAVYDIWDDFISQMEDEEPLLANPSKWFPEFSWSTERAPEGLHPTQLARCVLSEYLLSGKLLQPPDRLDANYDSAGGTWISIRSRKDIHRRYGRDGFWHFPLEPRDSTAKDVVMASLRTSVDLPAGEEGIKLLNESGVAVTFFGPLERCNPGQLNNDRYGIVVRSLERPQKVSARRVYRVSWAIAGLVAALAGAALASGSGALHPSVGLVALVAFPAMILGGLDSPLGAVVGGIIIGLVQQLTSLYAPEYFDWLGNSFELVSPYLVMILILLVRPYGLFGTKEVRRV